MTIAQTEEMLTEVASAIGGFPQGVHRVTLDTPSGVEHYRITVKGAVVNVAPWESSYAESMGDDSRDILVNLVTIEDVPFGSEAPRAN